MKLYSNIKKRQIALTALMVLLTMFGQVNVFADSVFNGDQNLIRENIPYFDVGSGEEGDCSTSSDPSSSGTTTTVSGADGNFGLNQVETFASEPVTSTWNISDSTVEQWFLKTNTYAISKYGLNSSNIGQITSAVEAANVSPVFFYMDTVNEGQGYGGFINHYQSDSSGGGPGNATTDAQYIASESKTKADGVATGNGEPTDMPTAEAANILNSLPPGSLGVYYTQATSAITAEWETLSGQTGDWSGKYGEPMEDMMQNIKSMGGDPQQGGSTISTAGCTATGLTGAGLQKGISFALFIAKDNGYGYGQSTRTTGWQKYQSDPSCTSTCGDFDCSSFISAILTEAGYFSTNPEFDTETEGAALTGVGFKDITSSVNLTTGADMQPGDILVNTQVHTAMYIGNNQVVQAADPTEGIQVRSYYNYPWTNVYRAPN
jgi:cell wall-associated NlpC family hydrolase